MIGRETGYVTDVAFSRGFYRELAPAWLDFTATLAGVTPPARDAAFHWCELGCGQGVTTVLLAATHPHARFVGIDLMPDHVEHARRLASEAGITNAAFLCADVASVRRKLPKFHYIVAHGVYSWVAPESQAAMRRFIATRLRPDGLVYLSYNAMPGRASDLPFQRLIATLAGDLPGDSASRFAAAAVLARGLARAGAPSLGRSLVFSQRPALEKRHSLAYLAHEYMGRHWQPLLVSEVRQAMAGIGLTPAGSATLADNFDSFTLRRGERKALSAFADPDTREVVRDFLVDRTFRRDVYSGSARRLSEPAQRRRLRAMRFALRRPPANVVYRHRFAGAGTLAYNSPAARAIVAALADGPRLLRQIEVEGIAEEDLLSTLLALCCAGQVQPVEATDAPVEALNRALGARAGGPEEIEAVALRCGTAIPVTSNLLRGLHRSQRGGGQALRSWRRYFDVHAGSQHREC